MVSSLPDAWVGADTLRKYIADWREGLATAPRGNYESEMLDDLEDMLPAPPAPPTMAGVEWSFSEHHRAEAEHSVYGKVVMMELDGTGDIVVLMDEGLLSVTPSALTPTGRKLRLIPDEDVPEGDPIETEFDPAYTYRDKYGDKWTHNSNGWVCNNWLCNNYGHDATNYLTPPAKYGPYTRIEDTK